MTIEDLLLGVGAGSKPGVGVPFGTALERLDAPSFIVLSL
jgi:hypothetical protein